jgi:hypothetical protein
MEISTQISAARGALLNLGRAAAVPVPRPRSRPHSGRIAALTAVPPVARAISKETLLLFVNIDSSLGLD